MNSRMPLARQDSRKSSRSLVLNAVLTFDDTDARLECAILNISDAGACILVPDAREIPASFRLRIDHTGASHRCERAWTTGNRIGVTFA